MASGAGLLSVRSPAESRSNDAPISLQKGIPRQSNRSSLISVCCESGRHSRLPTTSSHWLEPRKFGRAERRLRGQPRIDRPRPPRLPALWRTLLWQPNARQLFDPDKLPCLIADTVLDNSKRWPLPTRPRFDWPIDPQQSRLPAFPPL